MAPGFMSPQNFATRNGFSTIRDAKTLYIDQVQHFIHTGDNFASRVNNYKQHQNRGAKPRKTFMKSPKVIREKFEQSNLSDIGDQYTSFNLGKGWSMGEQSLKSLKQDPNEQSQTNLLQSRNDFLPKL